MATFGQKAAAPQGLDPRLQPWVEK